MKDSVNPQFNRVLEEMVELHDAKNHDYAGVDDHFKNFRGSQEYGVPPWLGAQIRHDDKSRRIQEFCKKGRLNNESARDSLLDQAVYAVIALALYDEEVGGPSEAENC